MGPTRALINVLLFHSLSMTSIVEGKNIINVLSVTKIEKFIMAGYGGGWNTCDIIAVSPSPVEHDFLLDTPHLSLELKQLKTLDIRFVLSKSHCILVWAQANDNATMTSIVEFGWTAIQHKRIGMMLRLGTNFTLDKVTNTTKLPFLIAAQLDNGNSQFLCPSLVSHQPLLQQSMCNKDHTDYKGKTIRVGLWVASRPYGYLTEDGVPDGVDKRFLDVLQSKMGFRFSAATFLSIEKSRDWVFTYQKDFYVCLYSHDRSKFSFSGSW